MADRIAVGWQIKPIVGWRAIHRAYFVTEEGIELISYRTLQGYYRELYNCRAVLRFQSRNGPRVVSNEPYFTLWKSEKWKGPQKT
jgi:hypothetical protein